MTAVSPADDQAADVTGLCRYCWGRHAGTALVLPGLVRIEWPVGPGGCASGPARGDERACASVSAGSTRSTRERGHRAPSSSPREGPSDFSTRRAGRAATGASCRQVAVIMRTRLRAAPGVTARADRGHVVRRCPDRSRPRRKTDVGRSGPGQVPPYDIRSPASPTASRGRARAERTGPGGGPPGLRGPRSGPTRRGRAPYAVRRR